MELVFGIAFAVLVVVFGGIGLAVGASAEGPDPGPPTRSPLKVRITRAVLLAIAAFMAVLGAEAALVAGWFDDPAIGRAEATVFLLEGAADLLLAAVVLMPTWTLRRIWVLRLVAVCWLVVGPPTLVLTFGRGPLATFYLGFGPDLWAAFSVVVGALLVWLSSVGGTVAEAEAEAPATKTPASELSAAGPTIAPRRLAMPPTHWRGIATGVALASLVAVSAWPMAQFVGINALGGCAPQWLLPSNPGFCVSGRLDARMLSISGQTTLPDGALVDVVVSSDDSTRFDRVDQQRIAVKNGAFAATFNLSPQRSGPVTAAASLHMADQPAAVVERYGAKGRSLTGPTALADGTDGRTSLLVTLHFDLSR